MGRKSMDVGEGGPLYHLELIIPCGSHVRKSVYKNKLTSQANVEEDGANKEGRRAQMPTLLMWDT